MRVAGLTDPRDAPRTDAVRAASERVDAPVARPSEPGVSAAGAIEQSTRSAALPARRGAWASIASAVAAVAYPLVVWLGLTRFGARGLGVVMLAVLLPVVALRLWRAPREHLWPALRVPLAVAALIGLGALLDDPHFVLAMPVLVNAVLFAGFSSTLARPVSMVERFARLSHPDMSAAHVRYCRRVTAVWSAFFLVNGAVAGWLALFSPLALWTLYTGVIAYVLVGALFTVEYVVRKWRFREYGAGLHDRLLALLFPPTGGARP